jgi:opacity protein-like surface antigen
MKRFTALTACLAMIFVGSIAMAAEGPYMSANLGYADLMNSSIENSPAEFKWDGGVVTNVAVGYDFVGFRAEGEIGYQYNEIDKVRVNNNSYNVNNNGEIYNWNFMANGYYDFHNQSAFTPFVMAGIGVVYVELDPKNGINNDDDTVFAYQFGAGVAYALSDTVNLTASYRYFAADDPEFYNNQKVDYASNNFLLGATFKF